MHMLHIYAHIYAHVYFLEKNVCIYVVGVGINLELYVS